MKIRGHILDVFVGLVWIIAAYGYFVKGIKVGEGIGFVLLIGTYWYFNWRRSDE